MKKEDIKKFGTEYLTKLKEYETREKRSPKQSEWSLTGSILMKPME